jgi:hypothetical protein
VDLRSPRDNRPAPDEKQIQRRPLRPRRQPYRLRQPTSAFDFGNRLGQLASAFDFGNRLGQLASAFDFGNRQKIRPKGGKNPGEMTR